MNYEACICLGFDENEMCPVHGKPQEAIAREMARAVGDVVILKQAKEKAEAELLEVKRLLSESSILFKNYVTAGKSVDPDYIPSVRDSIEAEGRIEEMLDRIASQALKETGAAE